MNDNALIDNLVSTVQRMTSTIDRIENHIDSAEPPSLDSIRNAYVTQLAQEWSEFSAIPNRLATLDGLQDRVRMLAQFVERFDNVAQQPRRSAIAQNLNTWLSRWSSGTVKWQDYLDDATDEQLEELETQLSELEQPDLDDEEILNMVRQWLKYQVKRLRTTEKVAQHVVDWVTQVDGELLNARRFVEELLVPATTAVEQSENPIIAQVRRRWDEQLREQILDTQIEVESLGFDDHRIEKEGTWQTIQISLTNFDTVLANCSKPEVILVQDEINAMPAIEYKLIDEMVAIIVEISRVQEWHSGKASFLIEDPTTYSAVIPDIQDLIEGRPLIKTADEYKSLRAFQTAMDEYQEEAKTWLNSCEEMYRGIQAELERLRDSTFPAEILQKIPETEEYQGELASLDHLVAMASDLHNVRQQVERFLEESLEAEEREVWQHFQELKSQGNRMVYLDEVPGDHAERITETVAKLAQKGLIKVRIEL